MITLKEDIIKENFKTFSHNGRVLDGKILVLDTKNKNYEIYDYEDFKNELLNGIERLQFELAELYQEWIRDYKDNLENIAEFEEIMEEVIYDYLYNMIFKGEKIIYEYYPVKENLFEECDNCYLVLRRLTAENRNALEKVIFSNKEVDKNNINNLLEENDCEFVYGKDGANHHLLDVSEMDEEELGPFLGQSRVSLEAEVGEGPTDIYLD